MKPKIVFLDEYSLGGADLSAIRALGDYTGYATTRREETAERCRDAEVAITNKVPMRRDTLERLPRLRLICVAATGMNHIDLEAAAERGIAVRNAVGYSTHSVTETTIGAAIALLRQTVYYDRYVKSEYAGSPLQYHFGRTTRQLYGSRWGIVGLGNIGRNVARVARALGCDTGEVFFTSCGSEADNWAIKGTAHKFAKQGKKHLITSCIEHHAVLHSMQALEREGFEVTYLPVDAEGFVSPADVEAAIRPDTALVTIMFANNEIGTIEPIEEIGAVCRKHGVWFHTDAVQAVGAVPIDCHALPVDMLSISAHKFNGPKGVGALYIRRGVMPLNFLDGGAQERGRRAGTENLAGIVGLATALEAAVNSLDEKRARLARMRDYVLEHIQKMPQVKVNGPLDGSKRLPNNVNASFTAAEGESLLLMLDMRGVCASSGSACASGSLDPSHVLLSIGLPHEIAHCSLRISFGVQNTMDDAKAVCDALDEVVPAVRQRSPLWRA